MNTRISAALLVVMALSASGNVLAGEKEDKAELARLEQAWIDAGNRNDKTAIGRILAPTFVNTSVKGERRERAAVLQAPPLPPGANQRLRDMAITITGDTAVVTGVNVFTPQPGAMPIDVAYTDVYVRDGRSWKAVASQETIRTPRAP